MILVLALAKKQIVLKNILQNSTNKNVSNNNSNKVFKPGKMERFGFGIFIFLYFCFSLTHTVFQGHFNFSCPGFRNW